ncbi:MAG: fasciclin domain-containing protein [Prevotella sp.]|nr:fasciclin domain-containing protein [Prevotella sp.]
MKRKAIIKQGRSVALVTCGLLIGASVMQSCKDDILTGQPEWLGNSIYEQLQDGGSYTTVLRLIDDLGQTEVLRHTGSKTLFAADDDAYQQWYQGNAWGVRSYEQLTSAQKKLLLNNAMINNAYLIELMSNSKAQGDAATPEEGRTMRRETALSLYDSVYVMPASKMPDTEAWASYKERGKSMPIFMDATTAPMIHFLPAYMQYNKITAEDLDLLTNHQATSISEAWVNGKRVSQADITCKNGYIQKVDGVIESSPNMAEIVRQHQNMSMWSHLLDRFSAPYYDAELTREYNRIYNNEDSAFVLRYYSKRSVGGNANDRDPKGNPVSAVLSFDPGWNQYVDANSQNDLHNDAGAMLVPTNEALQTWWDNEGRDLQDEYKEWDSIPDATLSKLLNVNMISTFSESVPSKFASVLNDAKETLGITREDVDSCFMGCNGVIYLTNKVFTPAEYSSVAYPALAHASTMNIIYWAIDNRNFLPYLLSMDSKYALMIPTNNAMLNFIDPSSYGGTTTLKDQTGADSLTLETADLIEFQYDPTKSSASRVQATRWSATIDKNGTVTKVGDRAKQAQVGSAVINTMLDQLMDQLIIVIPDKSMTLEDYVAAGYHYFKTKGGSMIRVTMGDNGQLAFEGGFQMEHNGLKIASSKRYPKTNGVSYQLDDLVPMGAEKSLYLTLKDHSEYQNFLNLLENDYNNLLTQKLSNKYNPGLQAQENKNLRVLDNYDYNIYIPTNSSIEDLQRKKILPEWSELEMGDEDDEVIDSICKAENWYELGTDESAIREKVKETLTTIVSDFVRYHVQDHSVAIGMASDSYSKVKFESMKRNLDTGRFYPLEVTFDTNSMTVTDEMGNVRNVVTTPGLYNNICTEYWFEGTGNNARLFMSSDVVVHLIDGPLLYENMRPWREIVKEALLNN